MRIVFEEHAVRFEKFDWPFCVRLMREMETDALLFYREVFARAGLWAATDLLSELLQETGADLAFWENQAVPPVNEEQADRMLYELRTWYLEPFAKSDALSVALQSAGQLLNIAGAVEIRLAIFYEAVVEALRPDSPQAIAVKSLRDGKVGHVKKLSQAPR